MNLNTTSLVNYTAFYVYFSLISESPTVEFAFENCLKEDELLVKMEYSLA